MRLVKRFDVRLALGTALFVLLALLLVTSLLIDRYQTALLSRNEEQSHRDFVQAESQIERLTRSARRSASLLLRDEEISSYLYGHYERETDRVRALIFALDAMDEVLAYDEDLSGVWFFRDDGTMIGTTASWHFACEQTAHPFFEQAHLSDLPQSGAVFWLGARPLSALTQYPSRGARTDANEPLIFGALRTDYQMLQGGMHSVFTVFAIGQQAMRDCLEMLGSEGEDVWLLDQQGRCLTGLGDVTIGQTPWFFSELDAHTGSTVRHGEDMYRLVSLEMSHLGWTLAKAIPFDLYAAGAKRLRRQAWAIGAIVLATACATYAVWAMRTLRPLREMSGALNQVRAGRLDVTLPHAYAVAEFEAMRVSFNSMLSSIRDMLAKTRAMEHERIELEIRNLQAQLNPHMVFNSITSIRFMAMMSGADKVGDMLVCLADLIRPVFSEWRLLWPLADELAYVDNYVKLLSLRFGGQITVDVRADPAAMAARLPCFTLQPLLENCVQHGMSAERPLRICVTVSRSDGNCLLVTVEDDGRGIAPDRLALLRRRMCESTDSADADAELGHTGIGVLNVCRRARMFTSGGRTGDMRIRSVQGKGTVIELRFPYTENEREPEINDVQTAPQNRDE